MSGARTTNDEHAEINSLRSSQHSESSSSHYDTPSRKPFTAAKKALSDIKSDTKQKSRRVIQALLPGTAIEDSPEDQENDPTEELLNNAAFDPSQLTPDVTAKRTTDKILSPVLAAGKAIANPKRTFRKKAVSKFAVTDRPYLSKQADDEYVGAHADLHAASSSRANFADDESTELDATKGHVEQLEDVRDARKVAWITSRHVMRVGVVANQSPVVPDRKDFYIINDKTGKQRFDWESYFYARNRYLLKKLAVEGMGEVDIQSQVPFDQDVCIKYLERILMASSPWQTWFLSLRSLYRWEDPRRTAKWAAIWFVIWYLDYVLTFIYVWIAYLVLQNRSYRKNAEAIHASDQRSKDGGRTALRFNELIMRHGPEKWLDPLQDEVGPMAQMQLGDIADSLEILANFYDWKNPSKTWATLFWFACAISLGALLPTGWSWKIITMLVLLAFFLSRPIASQHPQYRHVVNACRWIFWDIPTDAEWSFTYLRRKAQQTRERLIEQQVQKDFDSGQEAIDRSLAPRQSNVPVDAISSMDSDSDCSYATASSRHSSTDSLQHLLPEQTLESFSAFYDGKKCRLHITPSGLKLRKSGPLRRPEQHIWHMPWNRLRELRKSDSCGLAKMTAMDGIELVVQPPNADETTLNDARKSPFLSTTETKERHDVDSDPALHVIRLSAFRYRDQAFNLIIGFSGLQFQSLPPVTSVQKSVAGKKVKGWKKKMERKRTGEGDSAETAEVPYDAYQAFRKGGWESGWFA